METSFALKFFLQFRIKLITIIIAIVIIIIIFIVINREGILAGLSFDSTPFIRRRSSSQ